MRSALTSTPGVLDVETNVSERFATVTVTRELDLSGTLDQLAEGNNKFEEWVIDNEN